MPTSDIPMQHRSAEIVPLERAEGDDAPKNRFKVSWTTGAAVRRYDWRRGKYYEEQLITSPNAVRLERLNQGASVLNSHNSWDLDSVIGAIVPGSARMKGGEGEAEVVIDDGPENAAILRKIQSKLIRHISVGYVVHRYEKEETEDGPDIWRATDWEPYEISFVPIPADPGAGLRSEQRRTYPCEFINHHRKEDDMPQDIETKDTPAAKAAKTVATQSRGNDPEPTEEPTPAPDNGDAVERAVAQELQRGQEIRKIVRTANLDDAVADDLINKKVSLDAARKYVLDQLAETQQTRGIQNHNRVEVTDSEQEKYVRSASDWLLTKAGVARSVEDHTKQKLQPGECRGFSLMDLARECLERDGVKTRGMDRMTLAGTALTHRSGSYQTTSDFAVILENTMHKVLLAAYATTPDTWTRFCVTGSVSDFRPHNRYRLGSFGRLDTLNEHGEFKNKAIPDGEKESISATTRGNIISLTRQAIINDDMGAFNSLATRFGRAAKLSIEMDVYDLLAENSGLGPVMGDSNTLFHADHGNITTSAALTAAAIDLDRVAMAQQTDPSGNEYLDLRPAVLLLPISLGSTARTINDSQYDPDTVANKSQMKPNTVRGLFRDIVDTPRISGTRRYLFADPSIAPTIEVAFLDGQQEPFLDSQDGWRVDGAEWKVRMDYGVDAVDWRGAITNAGT